MEWWPWIQKEFQGRVPVVFYITGMLVLIGLFEVLGEIKKEVERVGNEISYQQRERNKIIELLADISRKL